MALNSSDTNVSTLVVNKCTKEQYDAMTTHSGDELYVVNEDIDSSPTQNSGNPISSGGVYTALSGKQNTLTFDNTPTANSTNPVTSGGVKTAIDVAPRFYLGTCSTAGNVAIKQVDITNFPTTLVNEVETPVVGSCIAVKFSNDDGRTSTQKKIKVNNTSEYPVWYNTSEYTGTASAPILFGLANKYVYYVFNGTHWVWVSHGAEQDTTYIPQALGLGYTVCNTVTLTNAKVAALSGYNLVPGSLIVVHFNNDVNINATLNINNKGAKYINFRGNRMPTGVIMGGDNCLFVYYNNTYQLIAIDRWGI